ncbi:hypothetical protein [Absidia glauca]|uniref:Uncharacterized protein n=1 Tax=Absidia glauca TaxID=4829 RepID=A0A163JL58_ABSGL|nr:hypothetical protein [Absidia glauca]
MGEELLERHIEECQHIARGVVVPFRACDRVSVTGSVQLFQMPTSDWSCAYGPVWSIPQQTKCQKVYHFLGLRFAHRVFTAEFKYHKFVAHYGIRFFNQMSTNKRVTYIGNQKRAGTWESRRVSYRIGYYRIE